MAHNFRPNAPFNVAMRLLVPTESYVKGGIQKTFPDGEDGTLFYGGFRTFNGTETTVDDVYTVLDTAVIETWYRPDIKSNCRIYVCDTEQTYDVIGSPENINMRNQYLQIRVQRIGGGA